MPSTGRLEQRQGRGVSPGESASRESRVLASPSRARWCPLRRLAHMSSAVLRWWWAFLACWAHRSPVGRVRGPACWHRLRRRSRCARQAARGWPSMPGLRHRSDGAKGRVKPG